MTSFDEQLDLSSPPVPARSAVLDAEFARVVAQAEMAAGPRRRRAAGALAGLAAVVVVGTGGAAAGTDAEGSVDEREVDAVHAEVVRRIEAHLAARDPPTCSPTSSGGCPRRTRRRTSTAR